MATNRMSMATARRSSQFVPPPPLGPYVRLNQLSPTQVPSHPDLAPYQSAASSLPALETFVGAVLNEGDGFVTGYLPSVITVRSARRTVPPAKATVQLAEHTIPAATLPAEAKTPGGESWFVRSSLHVSEKTAGTGDWEEFEGALLDKHSEHEKDYTPDVYDAHRVLSWDEQLEAVGGKVGDWEKVEMNVYEMAHKMPMPLSNRVFSVLVVKAKNTTKSPHSFIVVQIPIEITKVARALYSNDRHKQDADTAQKKKAVTLGVYVSVERCQLESSGHVKWLMATASDAKGYLPIWLQRTGIPGAIAKDVGLVIEWLDKKRKGGS